MARSKKASRGSSAQRRSSTTTPARNGRSTATVQVEPDERDLDLPETARGTTVVRRRRFNLRRALLIIGIVAVLLVAGLFGYLYWQVQRALPTINGTVAFKGLSAPVTVTRDNFGVPHIVAANEKDLYAAQGYVHAQDRLFQMFLFRTVSQGRLSELLSASEDAQIADKFFRTVGFNRAAHAEVAQLPPEVLEALQAYADGVNEFIRTHSDSMPIEFAILGLPMEEWQPVDTIAFGKFQAWDLSQDWAHELVGADLQKQVGAEQAARLMDTYPAGAPVTVPGANSGRANPMLASYNEHIRPWLLNLETEGLGSNNWVVDGTRSATGKPLLANDPHLGVRNPSIWYQMHLRTTDGKYDIAGFSFASAPGIVTGHNQNIAWGVTNIGGDVQDLYIEKLDPQGHPGQYQNGEEWLPLQTVSEIIKVKGAEPITLTVRLTERGPIVSDAFDLRDPLGASLQEPLSMQWTAHAPGHLFEAVYALQTASNWQEFREALSKWTVPGQNFVYADTQGNIGYQMTGEYPVRKKGDGSLPAPGYTGEYGWEGVVPFDDLARAYNPPEHFIATANNKPFSDDSDLPIRGDFAGPWRIERIREMLQAKDKLSVEDFRAMQFDVQSLLAKQIAPYIAGLKPEDERGKQAVEAFKGWDGKLTTDSVNAAIYEVFLQRTLTETLSDDLTRDVLGSYLSHVGTNSWLAMGDLLEKPDDPLWDRKDTPQKETRDDILLRSLNASLDYLQGGLGDNRHEWTWGKLHSVQAVHPFGDQALVSGLFNLERLPIGGDNTTVAVSSHSWVAPFSVVNHQSYRMIVDLSNWSNSLAVFSTGESGQPGSKHFGDMLPLWIRGDYNPLLYNQGDIDTQKEGVLTLQP
ncbi:MAG TPA: penicillin acylase family protein [Chloroflexia bacterium]|nr:penicillin acylase family protein [Chloroflexia bacterium]